MAAKPIKTLELHYTMIQFLINKISFQAIACRVVLQLKKYDSNTKVILINNILKHQYIIIPNMQYCRRNVIPVSKCLRGFNVKLMFLSVCVPQTFLS